MNQYNVRANPLHELAFVSLILGFSIGTFITLFILNPAGAYNQIFIYFIVLPIYHCNEFFSTSIYQNSKVHSRSFLIYGNRGNKEFFFMQLLTIWEYLFKRSSMYYQFFHLRYAFNGFTFGSGVIFIISGLWIRWYAMKTCGSSFSHYIATVKDENSKLITTGAYKWSRHPSYLGFWLFAIGIQLLLENYVGIILNVAIMGYFFKVRIEFEEWYLIHKLYGENYRRYKQEVGIWIPFVVIKKNI